MWTTASVPCEVLDACGDDRLLLFFALESTDATPLHLRMRSARKRRDAVLAVYRRVGPPTPSDALCIRSDQPCIFPLEEEDGKCARTIGDGRPVIVQLGVCLRGDGDSWIRQFCLAQDRLAASILDEEIPAPVVIIDAGVRSALWVSPSYLSFLAAQPNHAHIVVCGLSDAARAFAAWVLYPLPSRLSSRVSLHSGYACLSPLLLPRHLLPRWRSDCLLLPSSLPPHPPPPPIDVDAYGRRVAIEMQSGWRTHLPWHVDKGQSPL